MTTIYIYPYPIVFFLDFIGFYWMEKTLSKSTMAIT